MNVEDADKLEARERSTTPHTNWKTGLEGQLQRFYDLESIGICDEECTVYEKFADIVKFR